ncbi:RNA polymerase sigma factor [Galbitalea sp. SE-J8]|uniref:RNA polymerase sigma factor n=1 Tax=Galbitalea sp. SE-J8 TaxID=3054952 RepID=UPI00259CF1F3|nr:RNA polymerase sigma factor [Galbitalea sp. SE-J8]MDM4764401.1 RNA polymerase sigma factor [Galbitalea sp. SE-J8]
MPLRAGFTRFYQDTYNRVLLYAQHRVGNLATAEDISADTYRIAWQKYTEGAEPTLTWVLVIARNVIGNEYRRQAREHARIEHFAALLDLEASDDEAELLSVRLAVAQLSPSERELVYLTYWEDLPASTVAEVLDCMPGTIWVRLSRIRTKLRAALAPAASPHPGDGGVHG